MESTHVTQDDASPGRRDVAGEPLDVVVIGAGQAGLAMAWYLARRGVRYLLVDANREIGASWRGRWDSLRLFSPAQYDGLPGSDFPAPADTYPNKDEVADYLAAYAEQHAFPVLSGTTVTRVARRAGHFDVHTSQGTIRATQVVVATGAFQKPFVPDIARGLADTPQLHSSSYRRPGDVPDGQVLVVGAANSGLQIAADLARTHDVALAVGSRPLAVRQRLAGRDLFWWLTKLRLMDLRSTSPIARRMQTRGDLVIGTRVSDLEASGVEVRPRLTGASDGVARFADGTSCRPDAVIWATGFQPDYGWIDVPGTTDELGRPRHHDGRSLAADGLWFLGLPWQRTRGSSLLGFVQRDAEHLDTQMFDHTPSQNGARS